MLKGLSTSVKRIISLLLTILFVFLLASPVSSQPADVEIIINYQREDGDYDKWNIWSWPEGKEGSAFPFNDMSDFGAVARFTVADAETSVGFIVRTDNWDKDVDEDRFIDLTIGNEIWVFSEQYEFFYEPPSENGTTVRHERKPPIDTGYFGSEEFAAAYTFTRELGAIYSKEKTTFRLWAPTSTAAYVNLYPDGYQSYLTEQLEMKQIGNGAWEAEKTGDLDGVYYTFTVHVNDRVNEAIDPYARAAGVNGKRGMVVNLATTNPPGWEDSAPPPFDHPTDAVIYELHIRDFSVAESSGMVNKGKYLAFTEEGTKSPEGLATGIDHLAEMGITHLHLLPCFDFRSIDERTLELNVFNWGYDPENYNLPEGSFSTDPFNGHVRIKEFKQMVQNLHNKGIRVVMDVVYNHTGASADSNLNLLVPGYYYRMTPSGAFSNGSGCGNETASERSMMRRFIVDSVVYWATEYKIDGFRFDLMALHDIDTMNAVRAALDEVDPSILIYGEGWTGGNTPLPAEQQALKRNTYRMHEHIAAFSDDMRDGIKGHVFNSREPGFVSGNERRKEDVMFGIAASCFHPQIDYRRVSYSDGPWANAPSQTVNYASAHDNLTLWDKFHASRPDATQEEYLKFNKMSALFVLTSQGIPFFQAGEEFARTKKGDENSYKSPDSINRLDWSRKAEFSDLVEYYKGLIVLRKSQPLLRLRTADDIAESITFFDTEQFMIAYTIEYDGQTIIVAVNAGTDSQILELPSEGWNVLVNGDTAGTKVIGQIDGNELYMPPLTGFVLTKQPPPKSWIQTSPIPTALTLSILGAVLIGGIAASIPTGGRKKD